MKLKASTLHRLGNRLVDYMYKNPEANMLKLVKLAKLVAKNIFPASTFTAPIDIITNKSNIWHDYLFNGLEDIDREQFKSIALTFAIDAGYIGTSTLRSNREKLGCNIPWVILMDPTSACNLKCKGCWAAEYGHKSNLSLDEMRKVVSEAKALGTHFFMFTGGEPLVRKKDILTLVGENRDGVYEKVVEAMRLLKKHKCLFGTSVCYTSANYKAVTSDEFYNMEIENGAKFAWYFHYMPIGSDADTSLLLTPEQREYVYRAIRDKRNKNHGKPIFTVDFQNDGEFVGGCIAGGRNYFHINSEGDAEPCVFIHYSDANIREKSVLECLRSPLFKQYYKGQPFNDNMLRPCPMLENPQALRNIIEKTGAKSTNLTAPESAETLCSKCDEYAALWAPTAKRIWEEKERFHPFTQYYRDTPEGKAEFAQKSE